MFCRRAKKQLYAYVFNELTIIQQKEIENHLSHCAICSNELKKIIRTVKITKESLKPMNIERSTENLWFELLHRKERKESQTEKNNRSIKMDSGQRALNFTFLGSRAKPIIVFLIICAIIGFVTIAQFQFVDHPERVAQNDDALYKNPYKYEIVENVNIPDVTVLTYHTSNPKIKIVWFFNKNLKIEYH